MKNTNKKIEILQLKSKKQHFHSENYNLKDSNYYLKN